MKVNKDNKVWIKVTRIDYYYIDSSVNGWSLEDIIDDWFIDYAIDKYHATRDSHRIGNAGRITKIELSNESFFKSDRKVKPQVILK